MLTITWPKATEATMNIVIIFAAVIIPLDCPNNRADWPIPAAYYTWEYGDEFTRGVPLLCTPTYAVTDSINRGGVGHINGNEQEGVGFADCVQNASTN